MSDDVRVESAPVRSVQHLGEVWDPADTRRTKASGSSYDINFLHPGGTDLSVIIGTECAMYAVALITLRSNLWGKSSL